MILRSYDGQRVFVPCTAVLDAPIVNYTALGRRRSTLKVGVAFDSELQTVQETLLKAVASVPGVYQQPALGSTGRTVRGVEYRFRRALLARS